MGELDAALTKAEEAIEADPENIAALGLRADVLLAQQRFGEARAAYLVALARVRAVAPNATEPPALLHEGLQAAEAALMADPG